MLFSKLLNNPRPFWDLSRIEWCSQLPPGRTHFNREYICRLSPFPCRPAPSYQEMMSSPNRFRHDRAKQFVVISCCRRCLPVQWEHCKISRRRSGSRRVPQWASKRLSITPSWLVVKAPSAGEAVAQTRNMSKRPPSQEDSVRSQSAALGRRVQIAWCKLKSVYRLPRRTAFSAGSSRPMYRDVGLFVVGEWMSNRRCSSFFDLGKVVRASGGGSPCLNVEVSDRISRPLATSFNRVAYTTNTGCNASNLALSVALS